MKKSKDKSKEKKSFKRIILFLILLTFLFSPNTLISRELKAEKDIKNKNKSLEKYLKQGSDYCKKILENAFKYFCKEEIVISTVEINRYVPPSLILRRPLSIYDFTRQSKKYLFDYQLISKNGKIKEQRKLYNRNTNSVSNSNLIINLILSERPVYGPVLFFSKANQSKFIFIVKGYKKYLDSKVVKIGIKSNTNDSLIKSGEILLDTNTSALRKINVLVRPNDSFKSLIKFKKMLHSRLYLKCIIKYDQKYKDVYFPTKVEIIETYKGGRFVKQNMGLEGWEKSRTVYRYYDYKFFDVSLNVNIK